MTMERLEQYAAQRKEIDTLRQRAKDAKRRATEQIFDTVYASSPEFPFTPHLVTIRGCSARRTAKYEKLAEDYEAREEALAAELAEIEAWVKTVPDSTVRHLIELRFIEGRTWNATAQRVYGKPCGDAARKRISRFFEGNS